jgi:hypothetical protein
MLTPVQCLQFLRIFLQNCPLFPFSLICCQVFVLFVGCTVFVGGSCLLLMSGVSCGMLLVGCWFLFVPVSVVDF